MNVIAYQVGYTAWADARVLAAAQTLSAEELAQDFRSSEHSILGTLVHVYRAQRIWLTRVLGEAAEFKTPGDDTLAALTNNWPVLSKRWVDWSQSIGNEAEETLLHYHDLRGNSWSQPLWQIVLQVANHSTHHRGQAVGFIRALGHTPPNVDSITFARGIK